MSSVFLGRRKRHREDRQTQGRTPYDDGGRDWNCTRREAWKSLSELPE